jgi:hypothetical protein
LTDLAQDADRSLLERSTLEKQVKTYQAQEQVSWLTCYRPNCTRMERATNEINTFLSVLTSFLYIR